MLRRIDIEGYGLIRRAEIEFDEGATIFTGETGSGKTMLLGALDFALGARAGADVVRRGARKAIVTLAFDPDERLRRKLESDGFEIDPGEEATIAREMSDAGRSAVRVNGRASTAAYVREVGDAVAEIVGQHEAVRLLAPAYHLELLDRFAGEKALALVDAVGTAFAVVQEARAELERDTRDERDAQRAYDDARFEAMEIELARIDPAQLETLRERREYLENVERIATALGHAREALSSGDACAAEALGKAAAALNGIAAYGAALHEMAERATTLQGEANDLVAEVGRSLDAAEFDPAELESIDARLAMVERLQRKYGRDAAGLLEHAERARAYVETFERRDERLAELRARSKAATVELATLANRLTDVRKRAAAKLCEAVTKQFADIALTSGHFEVALEPLDAPGPNGAERASFLFAANTGEPARPLARAASGGELSRVLLALVVALAQARKASGALVFDEIDAGIGGATAVAVGARIGELARLGQVVSVTHLAQIATWAGRHYVLEKSERNGETTIGVRELQGESARESEIARMLSGATHDAALAHARVLVRGARRGRATESGGS